MKPSRTSPFVLLLIFVVLPWARLSDAAGPAHRVFILHSYESGHVCGQPQHDGVVATLAADGFEVGRNLDIQAYFMDTKRTNNTPELIDEQAGIALKKIRVFDPEVLITLDDNAFRTVALKMVDSGTQIVFSGLNGQPEDYNAKARFMESRRRPGHNITGVYEKLHIVDALRVHSRLFPGMTKVLLLVDPSPTGTAIRKQIRLELQSEPVPWTWTLKVVESWDAYRKEILRANKDPDLAAIYPAVLLLKDREGVTYTAPEIFAWTIRNSKKTEIPLNYAFTRMGLFGGAAVDFFAMGSQAGQLAARILKGETAGSISIEDANRYALVFNLTRARQLGIAIPSDILMAADEVIRTGP